MSTSTVAIKALTVRLRAAAWHDATSADDRIAYEMRTGRPWSAELPDLLICPRHIPCRILNRDERAAVEAITGPIPVPALNACRARAVLKRWAILTAGERAS